MGKPPSPPRLKRGLSEEDVAQRAVAVEDLEDLTADDAAKSTESQPAKKPRTTPLDKRPLCVYGSRCYRENPEHFAEFAHPWLDEENDDPIFVGARDGASSSTAETAPDATAAPPEAAMTPAAAASAAADTSDVRIIALRSLLNSLVKDASEDVERSHFQHLLNLVDAGPAATEEKSHGYSTATASEAPPPLPPPDDPPPAYMIKSTRPSPATPPRAVAAPPLSVSAAFSSAGPDAEAETLVTAPEDMTAFGAPSHVDTASTDANPEVAKIMDLGFSAADSREALKHSSDIQTAIEWLLAR